MPYQLNNDMSFCMVDDHCIFLDTRKDRYFRLSSKMERAFRAYIEGGDDPEIDAVTLIECNILTTASKSATHQSTISVKCPVRSAVERASRDNRIHFSTLRDVLTIVYSTRLQLATRNLNNILTALTAYRLNRASRPPGILTELEAERLSDAAAMFWRARVYVPVEPRCLLDSLAMVKFLAKKRVHASIVFGVTADPFAAHAWVQVDDLVLNDTVGNATAHTPILVV